MTFFNLTSTEIVLLVLLALLVLGPRRLPHYAARLAQLVRQLRDLAEGAKGQIREEMGPAFDDIDWRQLDPRQYDPRRIVREALREPGSPRQAAGAAAAAAPGGAAAAGVGGAAPGAERSTATLPRAGAHDPSLPTPFDPDAT
ncbi:translocase [Ornithinimicrobium pekingense]|uniref:Translocase n=1 Tax=Ornithinimicrobium pekingense TaxID=384677 RepID=A0ABQ2F624_9MICO|nr:translocase [Ornithinimicrobium pekingense]GGK65599.1 translocase [Ornithinimicrobium pekingense]